MSTGGTAGYPDSVEKIYDEFVQRRCGSLRALTSDSDDFFQQCDPESENLCLYGNVDGTWTVGLPAEMVPAEVPEPAVGINFARDGMASRGLWLALGTSAHTHTHKLRASFSFSTPPSLLLLVSVCRCVDVSMEERERADTVHCVYVLSSVLVGWCRSMQSE